jgi:hypothetical protein
VSETSFPARSRLPLVALVALALSLPAFALSLPVGLAEAASKGGRSRRADPRTGRLSPAHGELLRAHKRKDRGALSRAANRLGPTKLGEAIAGGDVPGLREAAMAAAPLARGGVLLVGVIADQLGAAEAARLSAAAGALGLLLDGSVPGELEEWEVPPDVTGRACGGLRGLAMKADAPGPARMSAIEALASAAPVCGPPGELAVLVRDPSPAIRRAAALVAAVGEHRDTVLKEAIADGDAAVSSAGTATACRIEGRPARAGKVEPPPQVALASARLLVRAPATPADDAVEMLDCLAAGGSAVDRSLLEEIKGRAPSPVRTRAQELAEPRPTGKAQ